MLSLLIAHIIITTCCLWSGYWFYKIFTHETKPSHNVYYLISGLIFLTTLCQVIVLFFPIGLTTQLVFAAAFLLSTIIKWKDFKYLVKKIIVELKEWSSLSMILVILIWVIILLISAGPVIMDDTESYHIQSIKWIQEYGSVPGLVNLHERFGFNSSWFSIVALFNFLPGTTGGFATLNGILSVWLCYWLISKYDQLQKENNPQASFVMLMIFTCCILIWPLVRGNAATANYDFITTCVILILFIDIFLSTDKKTSPAIEWITWPAYLFTIRIINFPLVIVSLFAFIFFIRQKKLKTFFLPIASCLFLIIPFLGRNIIIAGYPFYPATYFDWFHIDWKPDPLITEKLVDYIKYYNRVPTTYLDLEQTKALGSNWIPSWFRYLFLYDKLLVLVGGAGLLIGAATLFFNKNFHGKKNILLITVSILSLCSWLIISPDPRFVYGVLLFGTFLLFQQLIAVIKNTKAINLLSATSLILLVAGTGYYLFSKSIKQMEYRNWILPAQLPQPPIKEIVIDGITFRIPQPINNNWNARCYGTDLPCLYIIDRRLKPRGKNIRSGFRLEK